jgi:AraC-like DNA-binding protein
MNERRIRELAEQAGYKDLPTVRLAFSEFNKEKFAELIIRECATTAEAYVTTENYSHNKLAEQVYISPWWLKEHIKEHFGIEE